MTDREAIDVLFNEWKCIDRNDGIHCDRKCESCDLVMDVGIIREAFNKAISALQAQEAKAQLSAEGTTSGLISRQAAIDLWEKYHPTIAVDAMQYDAELRQLPSAQPELETVKCIIGGGCMDIGDAEQPEIIRCKDCKHKPYPSDNYDYDNGFEIIFPDYRCPCRCEDDYYNRIPDDDWFCGNAERRTDE